MVITNASAIPCTDLAAMASQKKSKWLSQLSELGSSVRLPKPIVARVYTARPKIIALLRPIFLKLLETRGVNASWLTSNTENTRPSSLWEKQYCSFARLGSSDTTFIISVLQISTEPIKLYSRHLFS